ncbi:MAG: DUF429 domain-containing protein [Acidimicrobiales bacterium]
MRVIGIDVGSRRLDAVSLDDQARVTDVRTFASTDGAAVVAWARGAAAIAIDSPDRWSTAPHAADATLPPKFRSARCAEIGLARDRGVWVPWTTPVTPQVRTWISAGIDLFGALRAAGHEPVEVYPHGVFRVLNHARRPPSKRTAEGRAARVLLLGAAGVSAAWSAIATHDAVDATAAALVALRHARGLAEPTTCGHDGSAIWLPAAVSADPGPATGPRATL